MFLDRLSVDLSVSAREQEAKNEKKTYDRPFHQAAKIKNGVSSDKYPCIRNASPGRSQYTAISFRALVANVAGNEPKTPH